MLVEGSFHWIWVCMTMRHSVGELQCNSAIYSCRVTLTSPRCLCSVIRWAHVHSTCNPYLCILGGFATTMLARKKFLPKKREKKNLEATAGAEGVKAVESKYHPIKQTRKILKLRWSSWKGTHPTALPHSQIFWDAVLIWSFDLRPHDACFFNPQPRSVNRGSNLLFVHSFRLRRRGWKWPRRVPFLVRGLGGSFRQSGSSRLTPGRHPIGIDGNLCGDLLGNHFSCFPGVVVTTRGGGGGEGVGRCRLKSRRKSGDGEGRQRPHDWELNGAEAQRGVNVDVVDFWQEAIRWYGC